MQGLWLYPEEDGSHGGYEHKKEAAAVVFFPCFQWRRYQWGHKWNRGDSWQEESGLWAMVDGMGIRA